MADCLVKRVVRADDMSCEFLRFLAQPTAIWSGGRAEFFSMATVMLGMALVMRFVTPSLSGRSPRPDTAAFWGFGALGLLVGFIVTYPMNWWLVKLGWKHGMA